VPHEPHPPPQHPPPPVLLPKSSACAESPEPATAKLETRILVFVDAQAGQLCPVSLSANLVRTSNVSEQLSHRYS
jgi:hypothetical protein